MRIISPVKATFPLHNRLLLSRNRSAPLVQAKQVLDPDSGLVTRASVIDTSQLTTTLNTLFMSLLPKLFTLLYWCNVSSQRNAVIHSPNSIIRMTMSLSLGVH